MFDRNTNCVSSILESYDFIIALRNVKMTMK